MDEHIAWTLVPIAGVGATFAGFSGVLAAFDRRAYGEWRPEGLNRLTALAPRQDRNKTEPCEHTYLSLISAGHASALDRRTEQMEVACGPIR